MSEKPEALRLAEELYAFHAAKKEMPSVGGQMLGLERYRIVASGEAFSQILNAAEKLIRLHAENERLREALEKVVAADDDPNDKLTYIRGRLLEEIKAALRREDV